MDKIFYYQFSDSRQNTQQAQNTHFVCKLGQLITALLNPQKIHISD